MTCCEVEGCAAAATEHVTVFLRGRAPETRPLCAAHATQVRQWATATHQSRPARGWLVLAPDPPPACAECRRVVGQEIAALWRRGLCQACYKRQARAACRAA